EALGVVELLDCTDKPQVSFLDQVEELHAAAGVALRERNDQADVGTQQVALRTVAITGHPLQVETKLAGLLGCGQRRKLRFSEQTGLDPHRELDLFGRVK